MRTHHAAALAALLLAACAHGPTAKDRDQAEVHNDLGIEAIRNGQAGQALKEFDAALQLDPELPEAWMGKGLVLEQGFNKVGEAEAAYRKAIALRPTYSEAHNNLGQLLARTGRTRDAIKEFDLALDNMFYKEPWVARCNKGNALVADGRQDEGVSELRACLQIAPKYCRGRRDLGRLYLQEGKTREAVEELSTYARVCDKVADAHLQLGLAHMRAGDAAAAGSDFERCAELDVAGDAGQECRRSLDLLRGASR